MERLNNPEGGFESVVKARLLVEVDHLIRARIAPGVFREDTCVALLQNMSPAIQEMAIPSAVSKSEHEVIEDKITGERIPMWLGKTAVEAAMAGHEFYQHESAHARGDIETEEAVEASNMVEGVLYVFVSPRMSEKDAPLAVAQAEHLADDDAVRVSWLERREDGNLVRVMESLLVKDIPLEAWVSMLSDEQNVFGKSIYVDDPESALSVMKTHKELRLPMDALSNGPVSIVESVTPYIQDPVIRGKVLKQVRDFYASDQEKLQEYADDKAREWLEFDKELAESLVTKKATYALRRFIIGMQSYWSGEDLAVINRHALGDSYFTMSRELAAVLESAQQLLLAGRASTLASIEHLKQQGIESKELQKIIDTEKIISLAVRSGMDVQRIIMQQNRFVAAVGITPPGGGCPGKNKTKFGAGDEIADVSPSFTDDVQKNSSDAESSNEPESWTWKKGVCAVQACPTRPKETKVGPCSICKRCQKEFDAGRDPTKERVVTVEKDEPRTSQVATMSVELFFNAQDKELVAV